MLRTLFTSSSGLRGHQELLDVIGNNLANVNTTGFKAQRLRFGTQFSETLQAATAPSTTGGTNPRQVGNGSLTTAIDGDFNQGNLEDTGNALDMAIQGEGFFVLNDGQQNMYTRAGAFSVDSDGLLVDSGTGMRIQRFGVVGEADPNDPDAPAFQINGDNNVHIDYNKSIGGRITTEITFRGNLDAEAIGPRQEKIRINSALTVGVNGPAAQPSDALASLGQTSGTYAAGDRIIITGTTIDGASVSAQFVFSATPLTDTLQDLLDVINFAFGSTSPNGATASIQNGFIELEANRAGPGSLTMNLASDPANASGTTTFNNFVTVVEGKEGDTTTTAIEVFDEQGTAHTLTFSFQKQADNEWDLISAIDPSGTFVGRDSRVDGIRFNEDGSFQSVTGQDTTQVVSTTLALTTTGAGVSTTAAVVGTNLTLLDGRGTPPTALALNDEITITGTQHNGTAVTPVTLTVLAVAAAGVSVNTVGSLLAEIETAFGLAVGSVTIQDGNIVVPAPSSGASQLAVSLSVSRPTGGNVFQFDTFGTTTVGQDGDDDITFEVNSLTNFATEQTVRFRLGTVNQFDGLTQFGGFRSAAATAQDGFGPGSLEDVAVGADGIISGTFSNGETHQLAQLAMATFANSQGLFRVGSNLFREDLNSGNAVIGIAGTNGGGAFQGSVLEASNVDVTLEFTRLITAQRGFQVNARAFTTADQVLQETVNLKQ